MKARPFLAWSMLYAALAAAAPALWWWSPQRQRFDFELLAWGAAWTWSIGALLVIHAWAVMLALGRAVSGR